jgi:hypothetical protein
VEALYHEFMDLRQWTPPGMTSEAFDVSIWVSEPQLSKL